MVGVRPDSGTGVLISAEETREVLFRIGGEGVASPRRSGRGYIRKVMGSMDPPPQLGRQGKGPQGGGKGPGQKIRQW